MFTDSMIICIENPKESTKNLLELISDFREVAGYEVNVLKSVAFLYSGSKWLKFKYSAIYINTKIWNRYNSNSWNLKSKSEHRLQLVPKI